MDFSDTKDEAIFRQEVRQWIAENAPAYLEESLANSGFARTNTGDQDPLLEAKKWQLKKSPTKPSGSFRLPASSILKE